MALDQKDLESIKDIVDCAIEKSEIRMEDKMDAMEEQIMTKFDRGIGDIAEMNRAFLAKLDDHESRIINLEMKQT